MHANPRGSIQGTAKQPGRMRGVNELLPEVPAQCFTQHCTREVAEIRLPLLGGKKFSETTPVAPFQTSPESLNFSESLSRMAARQFSTKEITGRSK